MVHNIDKVKDKQSDIKRNLDTKKKELNQLEERKQALLDSGIDVQNSDMDESTKRLVMEQINQALEENSEKGKEFSSEITDDLMSLEDMKQEISEMTESTGQERRNLEQKKSILDKFGLGKNIDSAISEMDDSKSQLENVHGDLIETEREVSDIARQLNSL